MGQKIRMPVVGMVVDSRICPSCNTGHGGHHPCSPSQVDPPPAVPDNRTRAVGPLASKGAGGFSLEQFDLFRPRFIQQSLLDGGC